MALLEKKKFVLILLVLMIVLNLALLGWIWFGPDGHRGPGKGRARDFLIRELKLDAAQQKQYDVLIEKHHADLRPVQDEMRHTRDSLFDQLASATPDTAIAHRLETKIGTLQAKMERITFEHFQQVRAFCRPDQQKDFDRVIRDALRMMAPPQGPPPKDGPHDGPPDGPPHDGPPN